MTILTKPFGDAKKPEKTVLPLVGDPAGVGAVPSAPSVSFAYLPSYIIQFRAPIFTTLDNELVRANRNRSISVRVLNSSEN